MTGFDLGQVGYTLEEFFLESTATRFEPAGPVGADGHWQVTPAGQAPFTTRLVVCRPSDFGAYTGTVILEWLNVSAGFDAPAHWMLTHRQVRRHRDRHPPRLHARVRRRRTGAPLPRRA